MSPEVKQSSKVGSLTNVLEAVIGDAHQADAHGDRRVPPAVDDSIEIVVADLLQEPSHPTVDRFEVLEQRPCTVRPDSCDVFCFVPVARVVRIGLETEATGEVTRLPQLIG